MKIEMGIGWMPDPNKPGHLVSARPGEYAAEIERLTAENERLAAGRDAAIRTLADSRFPPVTRINDAIAILSRSGIVQQKTSNDK